ncbi:MAG: hypothetical protein ABJG68_09960 [Crocinitomicaceae bacterium]
MLDSLQLQIRDSLIQDGGPYYHEFEVDNFFREPWNAYSSLVFFVPIIFWLLKLKGEYKQHLIILAILPLLFLNGLGSTLYHGFRDVPFFLYLDFLPASGMSVLLSTYLWKYILNDTLKSILVVATFYCVGGFSWYFTVQVKDLEEIGPNIGYFFVGLAFITPIVIILRKTAFYKWKHAVFGVLSLGIALLCRLLDHPSELFSEHLPQGTHFLWHLFTVLAVFQIGFYVYYIGKLKKS